MAPELDAPVLTARELQALVDSTSDVLVQYDRQLRHTFVSAAIEEIVGRPRADFIGRTNRELGMDDALCDLWESALHDVFATGRPRTIRFRFAAGEGPREFESTFTAQRDAAGAIVAATGVCRDITQRESASRALADSDGRLRLALAAAHAGAWEWDCGSGRIEWSPESFALYGVDPADGAPTYAEWERCLHPDDVEATNARVRAALAGSVPAFRAEFRVVHPVLGIRWILAIGQVRFEGGCPVHMTGINLDTTARRQAELALEAADENKDVFIATLAHELRNFLSPMKHRLVMLGRGQPPPSAGDSVVALQRLTGRMESLIDEMLDLGRIRAGRLDVARDDVDLRDAVAVAVDACRGDIDAKGQTLAVGLPTGPLRVSGDHDRLVQVLCNLLGNASKFSGRGGHIEIVAAARDGHAEIAVADNGIGLAPSSLESIFHLFAQVPQEGLRWGGLGIGLALARRVVEAQGGTVRAYSAGRGFGARFVVTLPMPHGTGAPRA